jgi:hypothetical protein
LSQRIGTLSSQNILRNFTLMDTGTDNIKKLFNDLRTFTFWDRLFRWHKIKSLLIDASGDLQKLIMGFDSLIKVNHDLDLERSRNKSLENSLTDLKILRAEKESLLTDKTQLESKNENYLRRGTELSNELSVYRQKLETAEQELRQLREQNTKFKAAEEDKRRLQEATLKNLNDTIFRFQNERNQEKADRHQLEIEKLLKLKETWSRHEDNVRIRIKTICSKHGVEYVDSVPFKGRPDNTLKINSEFLIFDAKSPAGDDLSNFPSYLKNQAENASKYVNEEDVRREIFLVVPTNTLEMLEQFEYKLSDYTAYVISIDALEPVILALRKIEDYEFAEQLSPEERENICRVIGKFLHLSKRRIQIDGFFAKQFFELLYRSDADLPADILESVKEFEKSEKLNPPQEKRAKQISIKELESDVNKIKSDATQKGIYTVETQLSKTLNKLPLYTKEVADQEKGEHPTLFNISGNNEASVG